MPSPGPQFLVGETVHLRSRVSAADGSKVPVDPQAVRLTSLRRGTGTGAEELLDNPVDFVREAVGEYSLALETAGRDPGVYHLTVVHSDGPQKVAIAIDSFVLQSG